MCQQDQIILVEMCDKSRMKNVTSEFRNIDRFDILLLNDIVCSCTIKELELVLFLGL